MCQLVYIPHWRCAAVLGHAAVIAVRRLDTCASGASQVRRTHWTAWEWLPRLDSNQE